MADTSVSAHMKTQRGHLALLFCAGASLVVLLQLWQLWDAVSLLASDSMPPSANDSMLRGVSSSYGR